MDNLQEHTRSMERDGEEIWKQDSEALQEAMDIISDYEKVVASLNRMIEQYERPEITRKIAAGVYVCQTAESVCRSGIVTATGAERESHGIGKATIPENGREERNDATGTNNGIAFLRKRWL